MSESYAILVFIKILNTFNCESGIVSFFDDNNSFVSIHKICRIVGINTSYINQLIETWERLGIAKEFKYNRGNRYLTISDKVLTTIKRGKEIKNTLQNSQY